MSDAGQIEVRRTDALSQVLGTGNTKAMLAQVEENVRAVVDVARDRGFVRRYGDNPNEFYGEPAWALLGMTYGLIAFIEWTKPVQGGWEARAVVRTREGDEVAAAEAMCTRMEAARKNATDHTLRAMAQTRARRNALRSALGAALVLAGFDFADPESPATNAQVGVLHQLERELGLSHHEGHVRAGVESYKDLTREQAGELIDVWTAQRDSRPAEQPEQPSPEPPSANSGIPAPSDQPSGPGGAAGKASVGEATPSSSGPEETVRRVLGDGEGPEGPPADPWNTYLRARADAEWRTSTKEADQVIRDFWRARKLGPPRPDWAEDDLRALSTELEERGAQERLS